MAISTDYPTPVMVNGYSCKNCTDVDNAKKHIDPAHPKSGPYGVNAKSDPSVQFKASVSSVSFGGSLSGLNGTNSATAATTTAQMLEPGQQVDLSA